MPKKDENVKGYAGGGKARRAKRRAQRKGRKQPIPDGRSSGRMQLEIVNIGAGEYYGGGPVETEDQRSKRMEKEDANVRGYQYGGYVPPAGTGPKGGKAGPVLKQWARGAPKGIASTAINRTPLGTAINVVGTGIRAARGTLPTKGPVDVGGRITSGIGSRMKGRIGRRKAKRKARRAKG